MNEIVEGLKIEKMIYEIRGKQVMLDSDLAKLYQVETKRINEAVKNNFEKFPERFSWKLTNEESKVFLVENFDQKIERRGGRYKEPRVFTKKGVAMLAPILRTNVAEEEIIIIDSYAYKKCFIDEMFQKLLINKIDSYNGN